jgi:membrane associated rhomboid family serine protease
VFTVLITVACLLIYTAQSRNEQAVFKAAHKFCTPEIVADVEYAHRHYLQDNNRCYQILGHIYLRNHTSEHLKWHVDKIRRAGDLERADLLEEHYNKFSETAPRYLTASLWQWSDSWNPLSMLSATFSHGSWCHVLGNLFFFVSFSLVVEILLGPILYFIAFIVMALGIGTIDNLAHLGMEARPSLGLSGVVFGMLALATYFAPKVKINFFYWFLIYVGVIGVPLWAMAIWYIGWNVFDHLVSRDWSNINYLAHLAGALIGLTFGATLFRKKRHWAEQLIIDEPGHTEDESWLRKLNTLAVFPVIAGFAFLAYIVFVLLFIQLIKTFAVQLLMVAPIVVAIYKIYQSKRAEKPDHMRFRQALSDIEHNRMPWAIEELEKLSENGYGRAQLQLAQLYMRGHGVPKLDSKAADLLRKAATGGNKEAQYQLGVMLSAGRAVREAANEDIQWLEKAAMQGVADASMSLAHIYENGKTGEIEKDKAGQYYFRAGEDYLKDGRIEDAGVALLQLRNVLPDSDLVMQLAAAIPATATKPV